MDGNTIRTVTTLDMVPQITSDGVSRRALSRQLGKSINYVGNICSFKRMPHLDTAAMIAEACGYEMYLIKGDEVIRITDSEQ